VDKDRALLGKDSQTFWHDPKPLQFKYEKQVEEGDLENSHELYMKIIKSKENVDYLRKCMEKRGLIKEAKNPLKGTRF
jgi:antirestriction protein